MPASQHWKEKEGKTREFAKRVSLGEMECAHKKDGVECHNTATHVKTITRTFVAWTEVLDVPLCDEHKEWYF